MTTTMSGMVRRPKERILVRLGNGGDALESEHGRGRLKGESGAGAANLLPAAA